MPPRDIGPTMLNSDGTIAAKKTVSSAFNNHRSQDVLFKTASTQTQRSSRSGVPNRGYSKRFCPLDCSSSVSLLH